jgi:predicted O-linked N-acetylglucosamine transferase (SPINDLY family)
MTTIHSALATALECHRSGQLREAEQAYRQILAIEPEQPDALHLLGLVAMDTGRYEIARECIERAIAVRPTVAILHNHLGLVWKNLGQLDAAIACYELALQLNPDLAAAHNNLGNAWKRQGRADAAIDCYRRALERQPDYAEARNNLGTALHDRGQFDQAVACYEQALRSKPDYADAYNNLGNAHKTQGRFDDAIMCYERALRLRPDLVEAHNNLGIVRRGLGQLDAAVVSFEHALGLKPDFAEAHCHLGNVRKSQGLLTEALDCYRRAREIAPDYVDAAGNYLYALSFCPGYDTKTICDEHSRWSQQFCEPLATAVQPHSNDRSADRRLRVGYVSPDFRDHVVGLNLLPLFREHDHGQFEIVCYSQVSNRDAITDRFESYADQWRDSIGIPDEALADQIRDDRIDVLVDLALHMAGNRLLVFARKPAPVQATFAGYPGTTGLATIDYRLTDGHLDPAGQTDSSYAEKSMRLADSFWCYEPLGSQPEVSPLPALQAGYLTFGCLNNFCKINSQVLKLWARVLRVVDHSQIMILTSEGSHRERTLHLLEQEGVARSRVNFVANQPRTQYLELYQRIDIGLDTLPYNGHTTSLDSLWMGVPVVTLVGQTVVGRAGLCQLMNLGLPELVARAPEQFVSIAVELAHDLPRLAKLRANLRNRMQNSPLMDSARFARSIEAAYRAMWHCWCINNK